MECSNIDSRLPLIYLAAPYSRGDSAINVRCQHDIFDELMDYTHLFVCFAPLLTHYQHVFFPRHYEQWLEYDFQIIRNCDAILRCPAVFTSSHLDYYQYESPGADRECKLASELGIPVFDTISSLVNWARARQQSTKAVDSKED